MMSKQDAYLWLADFLQVPLSQAHIGYLGEYYCKQVIAASQKLLKNRIRHSCCVTPAFQGGAAAS